MGFGQEFREKLAKNDQNGIPFYREKSVDHENPLTRDQKAEGWEHLGTFGKKGMSKT